MIAIISLAVSILGLLLSRVRVIWPCCSWFFPIVLATPEPFSVDYLYPWKERSPGNGLVLIGVDTGDLKKNNVKDQEERGGTGVRLVSLRSSDFFFLNQKLKLFFMHFGERLHFIFEQKDGSFDHSSSSHS